MIRRRVVALLAFLSLLFPLAPHAFDAGSDDIPRISKEELKEILGSPDVVVLDVRLGGEIAPVKIAGAVFENPEETHVWAQKYSKEKRVVLYCA